MEQLEEEVEEVDIEPGGVASVIFQPYSVGHGAFFTNMGDDEFEIEQMIVDGSDITRTFIRYGYAFCIDRPCRIEIAIRSRLREKKRMIVALQIRPLPWRMT